MSTITCPVCGQQTNDVQADVIQATRTEPAKIIGHSCFCPHCEVSIRLKGHVLGGQVPLTYEDVTHSLTKECFQAGTDWLTQADRDYIEQRVAAYEVEAVEQRRARLTLSIAGIEIDLTSHTVECVYRMQQDNHRRLEWIGKWPNFCRGCDGTGGHTTLGNYETPPDWEPCAACLDHGICPRCGTLNVSNDLDAEEPCGRCGWNYDDDGLPLVECRCLTV